MPISIKEPLALNELGKRSNNEDSISPPKGQAGVNDRLFLVCDGVGGSNKGEVASKITCESISEYIANQTGGQADIAESTVHDALKFAEQRMVKHMEEQPNSQGMATTLTFLYLNDNHAIVGWVGDSRVYQIRDGAVVERTKDHSYVQELIDAGHITEEEAAIHSQRNVILRAVTGVNPAQADTLVIRDVRAGDYFFLCTDGILEGISDEQLTAALSKSGAQDDFNRQFTKELNKLCSKRSRDNYSMYLVQIDAVEGALAADDYEANKDLYDTPIHEGDLEDSLAAEMDSGGHDFDEVAQREEEYASANYVATPPPSVDEDERMSIKEKRKKNIQEKNKKGLEEPKPSKVKSDDKPDDKKKGGGMARIILGAFVLAALLGLGAFLFTGGDSNAGGGPATIDDPVLSDFVNHMSEGREMLVKEDYKAATASFRSASRLSKAPKDSIKVARDFTKYASNLQKGSKYANEGNFNMAIDYFQKALEIHDDEDIRATLQGLKIEKEDAMSAASEDGKKN